MREEVDIHNYKRRMERRLELIKNSSKISKQNKDIVLKFYSDSTVQGLSSVRIEKYLYHLYQMALLFRKPFKDATKRDLIKLVEQIEMRGWSERTKYDYKISLRIFFRWLRKTDEYPDEVKWIKPRLKNGNRLPEEILMQEEVKALALKAQNPRDRALVLTLYESGCRIGELLPLRLKHVQFDKFGAVLIVIGKTGSRRVRVIGCAPALANWCEVHPLKRDSESFLWIDMGTRNRYAMMSYAAVSKMLRKLAENAEIKKRVNPHSFRHARATHLASSLTEAQMKELFGWVQSSDMASTYVHLSGRDVDNALLKLQGIVQEDEAKRQEVLKVRLCQRCQESNDPVSKFCRRCGSPLDLKIALDLEEQKNVKDDVAAAVVQRVIEKLNLE